MAFNNLQDTRTLWERCDLDTLSKAVLQVLINHRNSCSGLCNPGTTRIASETGMSTRSVKSRIALLTAQGVLKIVIKGTFTTPSGYAINLEGVATSECTPTGAGDSLVKDIHQTGAGDSLGVVQEAHEGSAGDAPKRIKKGIKKSPYLPPRLRRSGRHRHTASRSPRYRMPGRNTSKPYVLIWILRKSLLTSGSTGRTAEVPPPEGQIKAGRKAGRHG